MSGLNYLNPTQYQYGQLINEGSFARTYAVRNMLTKEEFAMKIALKADISQRQHIEFMNEVQMLRRLQHPHIIRLKLSWSGCVLFSALFPLMPYLSCADIIQNRFPFGISEFAMGQILFFILPAVEYLHQKKIIHRSIKGSHILVDHFGYAVLSGFKFAIKSTEEGDNFTSFSDLTYMTKCLNWLSPEFIDQGAGYSFNADVYSLGITILELCNGVVPFAGMTPDAIKMKKIELSSPNLWHLYNLPSKENMQDQPSSRMQAQPSSIRHAILYTDASRGEDVIHRQAIQRDKIYARKDYSSDFKSFTSLCLMNDKISRPSIMQLKEHTFMEYYYNLGPNTLLKSLTLNDGIHFLPSSADHGDLIKSTFTSAFANWNRR